jgi:hypothetical protein
MNARILVSGEEKLRGGWQFLMGYQGVLPPNSISKKTGEYKR